MNNKDKIRQAKGISTFSEAPISTSLYGDSYLFVVGINDYGEHQLNLNNAVKDAEDFCRLMVEDFGFIDHPKLCIKLFNADATRKNIIKAFHDLKQRVRNSDRLLIYYSGHGHADGDIGWWIPAQAQDISDYVSNSDIRDYIKAIDCRHTLLISDSCFSGNLLVRDYSPAFSDSFIDWERKKSRIVFCSGKGVVADGVPGENSPFAKHILDKLREAEGNLNILSLADHVTKHVRLNYAQQAEACPLFGSGSEGGQFIFYKVSKGDDEFRKARDTRNLLLLEKFIDKHPDSPFVSEAKVLIKELQAQLIIDTFNKAKEAGDKAALTQFLQVYPESPYAAEARDLLNKLEEGELVLAFQMAKKTGKEAVLQFLAKYPNSKFETEGKKLVTRLNEKEAEKAFNQAKKGRDKYDLEEFIQEYPESPLKAEAEQILAEVLQFEKEEKENKDVLAFWEWACKRDTLKAYQQYVEKFPNGRDLAKAQEKIKQIEEKGARRYNLEKKEKEEQMRLDIIENDSWSKAQSADSLSSYSIYLKNHPKGRYSVLASNRTKELESSDDHSRCKYCGKKVEKWDKENDVGTGWGCSIPFVLIGCAIGSWYITEYYIIDNTFTKSLAAFAGIIIGVLLIWPLSYLSPKTRKCPSCYKVNGPYKKQPTPTST